jgi:membrane protease YdiL (CAAX protease family)
MLGASSTQAAPWFGAVLAISLFASTGACALLTGERLSDLGFRVSRRDIMAVPVAFAAGATLFAGVILVLGHAAGGEWHLSSGTPMRTALLGLAPVLCLFLSEELLFRGYAFQQLRRIGGPGAAVVVSALLFGGYHLLGSGDWAIGAAFRMAMPFGGGLVFGYALVRTGSLAVPIGLHWGGNWAQSVLFGLGHPAGQSVAVWTMPLNEHQVRSLVAPDLLQHLPYLVALGVAFLLVQATPRGLGLTGGRI